MQKIYIAVANVGGIGGYMPKPIAASKNKNRVRKEAKAIANEHHKRIGVVNKEMVYLEYKNDDFDIIEIPFV